MQHVGMSQVRTARYLRRSAMGREEPLISEFLSTALEKLLTKIGGKTQISKTLTQ